MRLPPLPDWTWRNIIALFSLAATIMGAAVLTGVVWWLIGVFGADADRLITELVRDRQARPEVGQVLIIIYEALAWGMKLLLVGVIIVLLSLGFAITARKFKGEFLGNKFEGEGGDDSPPAAQAVANAAQDKATEIIEEAKP